MGTASEEETLSHLGCASSPAPFTRPTHTYLETLKARLELKFGRPCLRGRGDVYGYQVTHLEVADHKALHAELQG